MRWLLYVSLAGWKIVVEHHGCLVMLDITPAELRKLNYEASK